MSLSQSGPALQGNNRAAAFILATVVINMLGVGLAWPVLPKLVQTMGSGTVTDAAAAYAVIATIFALMQFLCAPFIGALSDRYGRRPVLLVSLAGLGIDYALTAFAPTLVWLAAARLVGGAFAATIATANAAMADISTPQNRARNFGFIGAAFGIGFVLGPIAGGWLGGIDIRLPFIAAAALAGVNVVFGLIALPETLAPENRRAVGAHEINPFLALRRIAAFPSLAPLMAALFITAVAQRGLEGTWVLYADFRFGWTITQAAWSLGFVGIMYFLVQGFLVGPAVRRLGEWRTLLMGFLLCAGAMIGFGLADTGWMAYPLIALYAVGNGVSGPALTAICSQSVDATRQGRLQGALGAVNSLAIVFGPFAASLVLSHVSSAHPVIGLPGAWFLLGGIAFAIATILIMRARPRTRAGDGDGAP